jgi:hypothetical protein
MWLGAIEQDPARHAALSREELIRQASNTAAALALVDNRAAAPV